MIHDDDSPRDTLKTDLIVAGAKVFDASWKCKKIFVLAGTTATTTGIGIFSQYRDNGCSFNIMVQASAPLVLSVLQVEAQALLLAAKLSELLNIDKPTLLMDNLVLTKATVSTSLDNDFSRCDTRHILANILNSKAKTNAQVPYQARSKWS